MIFPAIKTSIYLSITLGMRKSKKKHFERGKSFISAREKEERQAVIAEKAVFDVTTSKKKMKMLAKKIHFGITASAQVWKITARA